MGSHLGDALNTFLYQLRPIEPRSFSKLIIKIIFLVSFKGLLIHIYCHLKFLKLLFSCFTDRHDQKLLKLVNNVRKTFLKSLFCHPKFLKLPISHSTHEKLFILKFREMVKKCCFTSTFSHFHRLGKEICCHSRTLRNGNP